SACQGDNKWLIWVRPLPRLDGRKAAAGMKCYQQIVALAVVLLSHSDAVAEAAQQARPAGGGGPGSLSRPWGRGLNNGNPHGSSAHVRKPAQTSRRSGR